MWRTAIVATLVGCINQAARMVNPPPPGGGTQSCREIVETCDSACTQPLCLHGCTNNGTPDAQRKHDALLSCGEHNGCTDETCMRANCSTEVDGCQGQPAPAEPTTPASP